MATNGELNPFDATQSHGEPSGSIPVMATNNNRFQFGLRHLLVMVTGSAGLCSFALTVPTLFRVVLVALCAVLLLLFVALVAIGAANLLLSLPPQARDVRRSKKGGA